MFVLDDPSQSAHQYVYSGFGPSMSSSLAERLHVPRASLPKFIFKKDELSGSGSTADFTSAGTLFLTESFKGVDLNNPKSLEGATVYLEGAVGYLFGGTGSLMLLGINRQLLLMAMVSPVMMRAAIASAPAVLTISGVNEGLQDIAGFGFLLGQVSYRGLYSDN
ncbi:hypothetical protein [Paraburkholderia sp. SOS3]|jgi:hypothetical protein|uniref:hypothetical protein n=1 Tax=Paraburkholderia sp. SOS3 TaxID=1926494 RepID=UPI0009475CCA|nr:hypothetical protein [Paraburkholderia sp. SOS3]APR38094.1 hypothetical protein BTO02_21435 [Paraburkholderia sp. SOS3]